MFEFAEEEKVPNDDAVDASTDTPSVVRDIYSAPRRFDLGTIMTVTLAYALMFGFMRFLQTKPLLIVSVGMFITLVGVAQALIFGGNKPRMASMLTGGVLMPVVYLVILTVLDFHVDMAICEVIAFSIAGVVCGCLAGALVGGVFMVTDYVRRGMTRFQQR